MTSLLCRLCEAEVDHGTVCAPCVGALAADLRACWPTGDLHGLDVDLDITIAKMDVFPRSGGGGKPTEAPLPIRDDASDVRRAFHNLLAGWCRVILDGLPEVYGPTCRQCAHRSCRAIRAARTPADTIADMARYLHSQTTTIRVSEWGDECVTEIRDAVWQARRTVDRPAERIYAGPCPKCEAPVYGVADRDRAWCRREDCDGVVEDPQARREAAVREAVAAAPERTVTAAEAAMASRALGKPVTDRAVRKMAAEGRITPVSPKRPARYLLGDILAVLDKKTRVA
ncbi:hypothetical protein [Nocardiopsis synnemataformans]|uniref:hypothetical protein n=1 Tax=Nocardiopsis synnemataformans TaxID=61305 RepID=UPI003EBB8073